MTAAARARLRVTPRARLLATVLPVTVALALTAACTSGGVATPAPPDPTPTGTRAGTVAARPVAAALRSYGSCPKLRQSVRREALAEVTAYGLPSAQRGRGFLQFSGGGLTASGGSAAVPAPRAGFKAADSAAGSFSQTNNQEAGVDEPDQVKTDGKLLLVVQQRQPAVLRILDVTGDAPRLIGRLDLPISLLGPQVLLLGKRAVVLGAEGRGGSSATVVDLADPTTPTVERTFSFEGQLLDSRLIGDRIVLAVQSTPMVPTSYPLSNKPGDVRQALLINRRAVAHVADTDYLPAVTVQPGGASYRSSCASTLHPGVPSGLGTTSLVTLDPDADKPTNTTTVIGNTTHLYASTQSVWLATSQWNRTTTTDLHGFDLSDPDKPALLGTGSVPGRLLDQYAMSGAHGDLRVATTTDGGRAGSESRVTVLRPGGGVLTAVGSVTGLGKGERIFGVRYVGDLAYVVTFRQIDPLYVVDLADPEHPRLRGELELPGYSSTLFPLEDGRLLGIGVDGGLQLSTFDVADPDHPRLEDREILAGSSSPAQSDHHALLWWRASRILALPVSNRAGTTTTVFTVSEAGVMTEAARLLPTAGRPTRAVVVGDLLYSVTEQGLATNRLDELSTQAWIPFT